MTATIKQTHNTFVNIYSDQFAAGKMDFDEMGTIFCESLENLIEKAKNKPGDKPLHQYIAINQKILKTAIKAQNHYLDTTLLGAIEKVFNSILGYFNVKSSLEKIKEKRKEIKKSIAGLNIASSSDKEKQFIKSRAKALLARAIALTEGETSSFTLFGKDPSKLSSIFIAKTNGDVYEIPIYESNSKGGYRYYYVGQLHDMEKGEIKTVGSISNLPPASQMEYTYDETQEERFSNVRKKMEKEFSIMQKLKSILGINVAYDCIPVDVGGIDAAFMPMEHHDQGDLLQFIKSDAAKRMSKHEKLEFILFLLNIYKQLHELGFTHADAKQKNIVVKKDSSGKFIPTVIDLDTCVSNRDKLKKHKIIGTVPYFPPEYLEAYLNPYVQSAYRTPSMDTWALGLIIFHFMYNEDLIGQTLGLQKEMNKLLEDRPTCQNDIAIAMEKLLREKLPLFIDQMNQPDRVAIRKKADSYDVWDKIILSMLSRNPAERKSTKEMYEKLHTHIASSKEQARAL